MNKAVHYGDQVYIEISNLQPFPNTDTRLLCSSSFVDDAVFGVKSNDYRRTNFRNCIFIITPNLVDSKQDINMLNSLKVELSFLSRSKPHSLGERCLMQEIHNKEKHLEMNKGSILALNKKILDEMDCQNVCYGDALLLQHLESGYYLCADVSYHPNNPSLHNLRLSKERTQACYFKFFSYLASGDRAIIDYGSEMKLASIALNTVVTMASVKQTVDSIAFGPEDDEQEDKEQPRFASDSIRRDNILTSFGSSEPLAIGTALDSNDNNRIRLAEYCCRENLITFSKKKIIKNGDYVRFQLDDFYLTSSKSIYREELGLFGQRYENYRYNFINSIFQVIKMDHSSEYPRAHEIQSSPKQNDSNTEEDTEKFYLKHLITGHYLSHPKDRLYKPLSESEDEHNEQEIPYFQLGNSHLNHKYSLTRNSRVSLKAFRNKQSIGEFFLESEVESHTVLQQDINSKYFIGFRNSEDKIKSRLQQFKKYIDCNEAVGSFFKITSINDDEMKAILEFESYANALKHFMRVLQCCLRKNPKVTPAIFDYELTKVLRISEKIHAAIKSLDVHAQILVREFKIVDIIARFLYYFFIDPSIVFVLEERKGEKSEIVDLLRNFTQIILSSSKNNDLTHFYSSQYIRVFINSLLSSSPLFSVCTKQETDTLRRSIMLLLFTFLWEKDLDTFGQLVFYEGAIFTQLDNHSDYSIYILLLLNHYFSKNSPNLINTLLDNFINNYVGDETRLAQIFPKITPQEDSHDFTIHFSRPNYPSTMKLSTAPKEVQDYLVNVLKLIAATARSNSLKFWNIIINYYDESLCYKLLSSHHVNSSLKYGVLIMVKSVHLAYNKLPFDRISPKIQLLTESNDTQNLCSTFDTTIKEAEASLISGFEAGILNNLNAFPNLMRLKSSNNIKEENPEDDRIPDTHQSVCCTSRKGSVDLDHEEDNHEHCHSRTSVINMNQLGYDILKEGVEDIQKGNLKSLLFTFQIMRTLLTEGSKDPGIVCLIHHSLSILIHKLAERIENSETEEDDEYVNTCMRIQERLFNLLYQIETCTVELAFQETIKIFSEKVLKDFLESLQQENQDLTSHRKPSVTTNESSEISEVQELYSSILTGWRSKEKLYQKANRNYETQYLEDQVMESFWKIIENTDDGEFTNRTIGLIKSKTSFEAQVIKQLTECVIISENSDLWSFNKLASCLLTLNKILRRISLDIEFGLPGKEDQNTLDEILQNLEEIFLIIYDYEQHIKEEGQNLSKPAARDLFIERYRYSKLKAKTEIPFRYKTECIQPFYQKMLRILEAPKILLPFITVLVNKATPPETIPPIVILGELLNKYKLGYRMVMSIITIFLHKNRDNQLLLSTEQKFITTFYRDDIMNSSVDAIFMFSEMCRENKKLLKLSRDYLHNVVAFDFVEFYNQSDTKFEKPDAINYIASLPVIFSSNVPKDLFDPARFMTQNLFTFIKHISTDENKISLLTLLNTNKTSTIGLLHVDSLTEIPENDYSAIDMPIYYTILKELLQSLKEFAFTEEKDSVLVLQSSFTVKKIEPLLKNENIEFNFELKQLILETFENIYLKSAYQNTNIFLNYEHFASFVSFLFTDVYGYLKHHITDHNDKIFEVFTTSHFNSKSHQGILKKYDTLLNSNINNVVFLQYQSLLYVKDLFKKYILYVLCDFFGHCIAHFKDFMLTTKEKGRRYENIFEIWLKLTIKVREIDSNSDSSSKRLGEALKNAVARSEYAHKREIVHSLYENNPAIGRSIHRGLSKQRSSVKIDMDQVLDRFMGDRKQQKAFFIESNLSHIVSTLGINKPVLKRLIHILSTPGTPQKEILLILKLFRIYIENENKIDIKERKPIYLWDDVSEAEFINIHEVQVTLTELGLVEAVLQLFYQHQKNKTVFRELLLLCIALLYGGNKTVQDAFYEGFRYDYDNEIMSNFATILESILETMKIKESQRTQECYFNALQYIFNNLDDNSIPELAKLASNSPVSIPDNHKERLANDFYQDQGDLTKIKAKQWKDYDLLLIILEFLQTLCEGHYLNFQEFLRDQTIVEHSKSFNIPEFLRQAYHVYHKYHNIQNVETGVKILDLLIEIQQGESQENIDLMLKKTFINDLCNTLNGFNTNLDLLARGFSFNSSHPTLMEIKSKVLIILKDLVEKSEPKSLIKIAQYVDLKALVSTFKENIIAFHKKKGACPTKETLRSEDMWDPDLSCAFMVYFILKHLSFDEPSEDFTPEITETFREILEDGQGMDAQLADQYFYDFFNRFTGSIEIFQKKSNKLMRIFFPIPAAFSYLKKEIKREFSSKVDRTNTQTKIADLMDSSVEIIGQIHIEYHSQKRLLGFNFNNLYSWLRFFTNFTATFIVILDIARLDYNEGVVFYRGEYDSIIQSVFCGFQVVLAAALIWLWIKNSLSMYLAFKWDDFVSANVHEMGPFSQNYAQKLDKKDQITPEIGEAVLLLKGPYSEEWNDVEFLMKNKLKLYNIYFTLQSGMFLWHVLYLVICIGSSFHPIIAALQIFDIIIRSDTVHRVYLAVSRNLNQFLWTLILLFVTVYVYSLIGLYFLHERFQDNDVGALCRDAYSCLLASLNLGLRAGGGIADVIQKFKYDPEDKTSYLVHTLFDLSFFIIIVTILLNLIFGMIIDAFGDLRDEKSSNEEDMENVCFICGLQRSEYERTDNFEKHIAKEHNMWVYLAYLIYIQDKARLYSTEMTDTEDYVSDRYHNKDYIWIPIGRSLTLERHLVKGEKQKKSEIEKLKEDIDKKLDNIMGQTKYLISRMDEAMGNEHGEGRDRINSFSKSPTKGKKLGEWAKTLFVGTTMKTNKKFGVSKSLFTPKTKAT